MRDGQPGEEGNVSILTVFMAVALSTLLALAISLGSLYAKWSVQANTLGLARDGVCNAGFEMMVKSSDDPGMLIASKLASELVAAGMTGELEVWYAESDDTRLGANVRALAFYAVLTREYGEGTLLGPIQVKSSSSASIIPYGSLRTYDPGQRGTVRLYRANGDSGVAFVEELDASSAPAGLKQALEKSVEKALA